VIAASRASMQRHRRGVSPKHSYENFGCTSNKVGTRAVSLPGYRLRIRIPPAALTPPPNTIRYDIQKVDNAGNSRPNVFPGSLNHHQAKSSPFSGLACHIVGCEILVHT